MTKIRGREVFKVRITKSCQKSLWYSKMVGEVFQVIKWGDLYVLAEDYINPTAPWCHIDVDDCEVVEVR